MNTLNEQIEKLKDQFRQLSSSRKAELRRKAKEYCESHPCMVDASIFWRGLSARQVLSCK